MRLRYFSQAILDIEQKKEKKESMKTDPTSGFLRRTTCKRELVPEAKEPEMSVIAPEKFGSQSWSH